MNVFVWLLPLVILILSFISFRLNAFKSLRYKIYALLLFIAFFFDLTHLSFTNDSTDTIHYLLVTFIIGDLAWNVIRIRKPVLRGIAVILGLAAFGWAYLSWAIDGPYKNSKYWNRQVVSSYVNHKNQNYLLKDCFGSGSSEKRVFSLFKIKKVKLLEEEVRMYEVPAGYEKSDFNYKWSNTLSGVRLDLINAKDTVWTLGEEF